MKLTIPAVPMMLVGTTTKEKWEMWFAFWSLSLNDKASIVDDYPDLIIERPATAVGGRSRVFFNPGVLETQVPKRVVFKFWDRIEHSLDFTKQKLAIDERTQLTKEFLFGTLYAFGYSVVAYKYRYDIRPENFFFAMDYEAALLNACTLEDLASLYEFTR